MQVDISEALELGDFAADQLKGIKSEFRQAGADCAKYSKQQHQYVNRTGQAQAKTRSITEEIGDSLFTLVTIEVPYASYLMKGGTRHRKTSLTQLEDAGVQTAQRLDFFLGGMSEAIARK